VLGPPRLLLRRHPVGFLRSRESLAWVAPQAAPPERRARWRGLLGKAASVQGHRSHQDVRTPIAMGCPPACGHELPVALRDQGEQDRAADTYRARTGSAPRRYCRPSGRSRTMTVSGPPAEPIGARRFGASSPSSADRRFMMLSTRSVLATSPWIAWSQMARCRRSRRSSSSVRSASAGSASVAVKPARTACQASLQLR
jgi:hypothetical protein